LLALSIFGAALCAQGETRRYADGKNRVSLSLPSSWAVELVQSKALFEALLRLPNRKLPIELQIWHLKGMRSPRAQAYIERPEWIREFQPSVIRVRVDPIPHVMLRYRDGDQEWTTAEAYLMRHSHGLAVRIHCQPDFWPTFQPALFELAATVDTTLPEWPPRPQGYAETARNGYVYLRHSHVTAKEIAALQKFLRKREKEFTSGTANFPHGPGDRR
jgi:hypothetical protein